MDDTKVLTPPTAEVSQETPAPADVTPVWIKDVDATDAKDLRRHPKIAGIVGSELERAHQRWEADRAQKDADQKVLDDEERRLEKARNQPYEMAEDVAAEIEKKRSDRELNVAQSRQYNDLADQIGGALAEIPEWAELSPEEKHTELSKAMADKKLPGEVWGPFVATTAKLIAKRLAAKEIESYKAANLVAERAAMRAELTAELLNGSQEPDVARARGPGRIDPANLSDADFKEYYERKYRR